MSKLNKDQRKALVRQIERLLEEKRKADLEAFLQSEETADVKTVRNIVSQIETMKVQINSLYKSLNSDRALSLIAFGNNPHGHYVSTGFYNQGSEHNENITEYYMNGIKKAIFERNNPINKYKVDPEEVEDAIILMNEIECDAVLEKLKAIFIK